MSHNLENGSNKMDYNMSASLNTLLDHIIQNDVSNCIERQNRKLLSQYTVDGNEVLCLQEI
jgi:hypothetical protein